MNTQYNYIDPIPPQNPRKYKVKYKPLPRGCEVDQPNPLPENSGKIELTRGLFAIVDLDVLKDLQRFSWSAAPDFRTCYAITRDVNKNTIRMHKHILKIPNGINTDVNHINGNGLDNRRCNLEEVNHTINMHPDNCKPKIDHENKYKGVRPSNVKGYTAFFRHEGLLYKKNFDDELQAAMYYDCLVLTHRSDKAKTNLSLGAYDKSDIVKYSGFFEKLPEGQNILNLLNNNSVKSSVPLIRSYGNIQPTYKSGEDLIKQSITLYQLEVNQAKEAFDQSAIKLNESTKKLEAARKALACFSKELEWYEVNPKIQNVRRP